MPDSVKVFTKVFILPCDRSGSGGMGTVVVKGDRIQSVTFDSVQPGWIPEDAETVDGSGKVLLPGFIDLHVHGESYLLATQTEGEPQAEWDNAKAYVRTRSRLHDGGAQADWEVVYRAAYVSALKSGVTFLGEYGTPLSDHALMASLEAFRTSAIRGFVAAHTVDQLEIVRRHPQQMVSCVLALPPSEEWTTYNLQVALRSSKTTSFPVLAHVAESAQEVEFLRKTFRRTPLQILSEYGLLDSGCIAVHFSVLEPDDVPILKSKHVVPVLAPWSAAMKGLPVSSTALLVREDLPFALCSDWGASSPWESMRSMLAIARSESGRVPKPLTLLSAVSRLPAEILGVQRDIGSVEPGKKADIQLLDCRRFLLGESLGYLTPQAVAHVLLTRASGADVSEVMVNGEFYVRQGEVLTYSSEDLEQGLSRLLSHQDNDGATLSELPAPMAPMEEQPAVVLDDVGDEGFRVVRKGERIPHPPATILPMEPRKEPPQTEPRTIRKVFGEDDV